MTKKTIEIEHGSDRVRITVYDAGAEVSGARAEMTDDLLVAANEAAVVACVERDEWRKRAERWGDDSATIREALGVYANKGETALIAIDKLKKARDVWRERADRKREESIEIRDALSAYGDDGDTTLSKIAGIQQARDDWCNKLNMRVKQLNVREKQLRDIRGALGLDFKEESLNAVLGAIEELQAIAKRAPDLVPVPKSLRGGGDADRKEAQREALEYVKEKIVAKSDDSAHGRNALVRQPPNEFERGLSKAIDVIDGAIATDYGSADDAPA